MQSPGPGRGVKTLPGSESSSPPRCGSGPKCRLETPPPPPPCALGTLPPQPAWAGACKKSQGGWGEEGRRGRGGKGFGLREGSSNYNGGWGGPSRHQLGGVGQTHIRGLPKSQKGVSGGVSQQTDSKTSLQETLQVENQLALSWRMNWWRIFYFHIPESETPSHSKTPTVRGRHGGVEKRGRWKTSRMTSLPKGGFGHPLVRYVFHPPQVSVLCFLLYKNPRQSRPEALLDGSKHFRESAFSGTFSSPHTRKWPRSLFRPVQARSWKERSGPGWDQDGPGWPPPRDLDGFETL